MKIDNGFGRNGWREKEKKKKKREKSVHQKWQMRFEMKQYLKIERNGGCCWLKKCQLRIITVTVMLNWIYWTRKLESWNKTTSWVGFGSETSLLRFRSLSVRRGKPCLANVRKNNSTVTRFRTLLPFLLFFGPFNLLFKAMSIQFIITSKLIYI